MKTTKKIAALGVMLLFAVISAYAANIDKGHPPVVNPMIRHIVYIESFNDVPFTGTYVVEIRNESGQLVAYPQLFVPGTSKYVFNERPFEGEGARTAYLRLVTNTDPWLPEKILTATHGRSRDFLKPERLTSTF